MSNGYGEVAFTEDVQDAQTRNGSRSIYARVAARTSNGQGPDPLTETERAFLRARDGVYVATVSQTAWPHARHDRRRTPRASRVPRDPCRGIDP